MGAFWYGRHGQPYGKKREGGVNNTKRICTPGWISRLSWLRVLTHRWTWKGQSHQVPTLGTREKKRAKDKGRQPCHHLEFMEFIMGIIHLAWNKITFVSMVGFNCYVYACSTQIDWWCSTQGAEQARTATDRMSVFDSYLRYCWMSSSTVSRASGGGTPGMVNWCSNGLGCSLWKDAWHISMGWPCWMAFTDRTQKLRPSWLRSTWYSTGTLGSPVAHRWWKGRSAVHVLHYTLQNNLQTTTHPTPYKYLLSFNAVTSNVLHPVKSWKLKLT